MRGVCMRRLLIIRPLDTRVGTIDVAIPKLRSGTYFPEGRVQLSVYPSFV